MVFFRLLLAFGCAILARVMDRKLIIEAMDGKLAAIAKCESDLRVRAELRQPEYRQEVQREQMMLEAGEIYRWTQETIGIAKASTVTFPLDAKFDRSWLYTPAGWWWLGRDANLIVHSPDPAHNGMRQRVCAISYGLFDGGAAAFLSDRSAIKDSLNSKPLVLLGAFTYDHLEKQIGPVPSWYGFWPEGETLEQTLKRETSTPDKYRIWSKNGIQILPFFAAASLWLQQKIVSLQSVKYDGKGNPPRRFRRKDAKWSVQIIRLRRRENISQSTNSHGDIEWTCHWVVKGHWRNQFYPSTNTHHPIWIDPYLKGDETKPLKLHPDRVYVVQR